MSSSRVQLEVAFLDADQDVSAHAAPAVLDDRARLTVLVVAAEADLRHYVRECLRERTDLWVVEAATVVAAITLAAECAPALLVVDEPERAVLGPLSPLRAIVIVDDVPHGAPRAGARRGLLGRPFTADGLAAEVDRLLG